jgi:adenosylcobinamide kinase/adenosylcobinamide-phosphate guanylyltransferase
VVAVEITLLGTGSADGWPNAFCGCSSCLVARASEEVRSQTSVLVDDVLLLDCGPETLRQSVRAGRSLGAVTDVLVTHAHPDHFDPAVLLYRGWVTDAPLQVIGPAPVVEACEHWIAPGDDRITLTPVAAGQRLTLGEHRVTVLPARHAQPGDAVLYAVERGDRRLLYATDTGPLLADELEPLRDEACDLVLLEETFGDRTVDAGDHLNLTTFGQTVAVLRDLGIVTRHTDVVAVHLSHHNPPAPQLADRLATVPARVVSDGTTITVGGLRGVPPRTCPARPVEARW